MEIEKQKREQMGKIWFDENGRARMVGGGLPCLVLLRRGLQKRIVLRQIYTVVSPQT